MKKERIDRIRSDRLNNEYKNNLNNGPSIDSQTDGVALRPPLINNFRSNFDETPVSKVNSWLSGIRFYPQNIRIE